MHHMEYFERSMFGRAGFELCRARVPGAGRVGDRALTSRVQRDRQSLRRSEYPLAGSAVTRQILPLDQASEPALL